MILYVAATICLSHAALGQSGRRPNRGAPPSAPPVPAAPATDARAAKPAAPISSVIVAAEIAIDADRFSSNYDDEAVAICMERLKQRRVLEVVKGGKMTRKAAEDRAKLETGAYVLWLQVKMQMKNVWGELTIPYIDYFVFMPRTAKVLTEGRVDPNKRAVMIGSVPVPPAPRRPPPAIIQLKDGAREVADRVRGKL
ncbi:MAG TPA: hypothetical protein VM864_06775 [Pyrinomonadaceae bacterium]|nr:hypothetical protein [Pyrinomonadaceae bacterium]